MTYYYTLMTSLPRHSSQFRVKETPISRIQLEKRFKMLTDVEQNILKEMETLLWASWFSSDHLLTDIVFRAKKLLQLNNPFITELIKWHLDLRSLFVALRLRKSQQSHPANIKEYWYGDLSTRLINHWNEPDFGLRFRYPWLIEVNKKLAADEVADLENILLVELWKHLNTIECGHYFDFAALIIYLLRFNIVNYWSQFDETAAVKRMNEIAKQVMDESEWGQTIKHED